MPYLHMDMPFHTPTQVKRDLAQRMGNLYAEIMETTPDIVHIGFRELGEGGIWQCGKDAPAPGVILALDIRRGRPPEQRARLASALIDACAEALGIDPTEIAVEFTQHAGDEIFLKRRVDGVLRGSLGRDWSPSETQVSVLDALTAEARSAA